MTDRPEDRQGFASRTPENHNPQRVRYRRGFVTRHQVSGWRFVMRRIASGVALHDTRMVVDPLRTQSRAVAVGFLLVITGLAGCFVFSLIRPGGQAGEDVVLADRSTAALYVRIGERLHPVLNLTSARLIAGQPVNPTAVPSRELDKFPRGSTVGIPGAPERMVQNLSPDAEWTVCDGPDGIALIAGSINPGSGRAAQLPDDQAVLVASDSGTWLLWGGKRSAIDLANGAVTSALGLGSRPAPRWIDVGLFNAIPEAPALLAPPIPDAGAPPPYPLSAPAPIGAVLASYAHDGSLRYYAVLPDGLQQISAPLAALLRNTNSYGIAQPPRLPADEIARAPVSAMLDTAAYPAQPVTLVDPKRAPVTCARWFQPAASSTGAVTLLSGSALPLTDSVNLVDLVGGGTGGVAQRVAIPVGRGYFVGNAAGEFWLSDVGVSYGIDADDRATDTAAALGLAAPALPIPSAMLALLAPGPTLSKRDALLAHDGLAPDTRPARRVQEAR